MSKATDRYLYAIRALKEQYLCVRAVDAAHFLGFSKASVSLSLRQMRDQGLIQVEPDGNLVFTDAGKARAELVSARVNFFRRFLLDAGVEPSVAAEDALSLSWEINEASFQAIKAMLDNNIIEQ